MDETCPRPRWKGPLAAVLVCAHCSLTVLAALLAGGVAVLPPLWGVEPVHVLVPAFMLGALALWLWSGRSRPARGA